MVKLLVIRIQISEDFNFELTINRMDNASFTNSIDLLNLPIFRGREEDESTSIRPRSKAVLTRLRVQITIVGFLQVLGNVLAAAGPLSTGHVEMCGPQHPCVRALRAIRLRHVSLHRAAQVNGAEAVV